MQAKFGIERELDQSFRVIDYHNGNGDFHFHSQIEIMIVTDGEVDALVNDHRKRLGRGDVSIALGYDTHTYAPVVDAMFSVLILPPDVCRDFTAAIGGKTIASPFVCGAAAEKIGALVAPVGEKWWEYKNSRPDLELYWSDGAHASPAGSDFAAEQIWQTIRDDLARKGS